MREQVRDRSGWLDLTRTCAIICVVLCHVIQIYYRPVLVGEKHIGLLPWVMENLLFTIGRMGVPLFLAISGALLLKKEIDVKKFYCRSLIPLLATTEIWIVINYLFVCVLKKNEFQVLSLLKQMLFLEELSLSHMWYMPMILGIYVALPFLAKVMQQFQKTSDFLLIYVLGVIVGIVFPTINTLGKEACEILPDLAVELDVNFWGGCFGLYIVGGYFIACRKVLAGIKTRNLCAVALVAFLFNSMGQYYLYTNQYYKTNGLYWYTDMAIFIGGLILFELFRRGFEEKEVRLKKILEYVSRCSFGIYLLHKPLLDISEKYLALKEMNIASSMVILFLIGFGGGLVILLPFVVRWRKIGRLLFGIK